jgi:hypothetical protein
MNLPVISRDLTQADLEGLAKSGITADLAAH